MISKLTSVKVREETTRKNYGTIGKPDGWIKEEEHQITMKLES